MLFYFYTFCLAVLISNSKETALFFFDPNWSLDQTLKLETRINKSRKKFLIYSSR